MTKKQSTWKLSDAQIRAVAGGPVYVALASMSVRIFRDGC